MRVFILITVLLFGLNGTAQKKIDCSVQTQEYKEFLVVKNFSEAFIPWEFVKKNCPKQSENIYTDGVSILQYKIDTDKDEEEKELLVRELMKLYDQFYKNFPNSIEDYQVCKAMVLVDNAIDSKEEIFQLLDAGFATSLEKVTSGNAIFIYFKLLVEKNQNADKSATNDKVIEKYTMLSNHVNSLSDSNPSAIETYVAAKRGLNSLASSFLNCDVLTAYYEKKLSENKENQVWMQAALSTMLDKCSSTPIFLTIAKQYYALKVSSESANYLATASLKNRNFENAKKFYLESAELEKNLIDKATKYYSLATGLYSGDKSKSKELLLKSLEFNPKLGKAYLFLAQLYANSATECGKTDFDKKAVYYLATQTVKKASVADEMLKANVEMFVADFSKHSISASEISNAKMNGKTITIGCWINEKITFPSK